MVQTEGIIDDEHWMTAALTLAAQALAQGEFPVGCVLVARGRAVGKGWRHHSAGSDANELDHAEIAALRDWISRGRPLSAADRDDVTAYCTLEPCLMCLGALILNGVRRIVYAYEDVMGGAAGLDFSRPSTAAGGARRGLYHPGAVMITGGVGRRESLGLLKEFFSDPSRSYWRGSELSRYTMAQKGGRS